MEREDALVILKVCPVSSFEAAQCAAEELIELPWLIADRPERQGIYQEIARIIADVYMHAPHRPIVLDGEETVFGYAQELFKQLTADNVKDVVDALDQYPSLIRHKRAFIRTALYNRLFEQETEVKNLWAVNHRL